MKSEWDLVTLRSNKGLNFFSPGRARVTFHENKKTSSSWIVFLQIAGAISRKAGSSSYRRATTLGPI